MLPILIFLVIATVYIGTPIYIYKKGGKAVKIALTLVLIIALPINYYMTTSYKVQLDENTIGLGWPISRVFFQRSAPGEPYVDYIGLTFFLAYPMNYVLYTLLPVVALLVFNLIGNRKRKKRIDRNDDSSRSSSSAHP